MNSKVDPETVDHYLLNVDNPLVVPVGKKIRFLFTGGDVIHSWWVPALGWKKDTIPGFVTDGWATIEKPGVYRGQCTELCGRDHGFMPIVVVAKPEDEYRQWVADQRAKMAANLPGGMARLSRDELMAKGESVYNANCAGCHMGNGEGIPGSFPPIKGSPVVKGPVADHIRTIVNGKGRLMPAFGSTLSDLDIAAVITYQRNAFDNALGDLVQPADVQAKLQ